MKAQSKNWKDLLKWSRENFSHLPWRKNRSVYRTLVSEIMLQQTTVGTVLSHYERFLEKYPTLRSLASASEEEVLIQWKGLGYYRRARNLKKAAEYLVKHQPENFKEWKEVPGVGDYTASAVLSLNFGENYLAVDANIDRVLSRYFALSEKSPVKRSRALKERFDLLKLKSSYGDLNEAMMDLGRNYCQANSARCSLCFLSTTCQAKKLGPLKFPFKKEKKKSDKEELKVLRLILVKGDKVLASKRASGKWLEGQWELPSFLLESTDSSLTQYPKPRRKCEDANLKTFNTVITKYKIKNYVKGLKRKKDLEMYTTGVSLSSFEYVDKKKLTTTSLKALDI